MEMTQFSASSSAQAASPHPHDNDESTFLCGYQKIRRYGSTNSDLGANSQSSSSSSLHSGYSSLKFGKIIVHQVEPSDTLQSLELKYNSSMYEIKRINRLWSNASLHCKTHLSIPVLENGESAAPSQPTSLPGGSQSRTKSLERVEEHDSEESLDQFFMRIDRNVKKTQKAVKKLNRAPPCVEDINTPQ